MFSLVATVAFAFSAMQSQIPMFMIHKKDGYWAALQFCDAIKENIPQRNISILAPIVSAIRYAENGNSGKEYGILHKKCKPNYRSQAGWCAATVSKRYNDWLKNGNQEYFIQYLSKSYAPVGASNDSRNLNKNWLTNVTYYVRKQEAIGTRLGL